jgi:heme/copper-type cytochrome/quinol oxidase subunit 2
MSTMYGILAAAGWIWAGVFFVVLATIAWRHRRRAGDRGFEAVTEHDKPG